MTSNNIGLITIIYLFGLLFVRLFVYLFSY